MTVAHAAAGTCRSVVIIGGGISGLAAAHRALELGATRGETPALTVIEARPRLGGVLGSERVDGFVVEAGADSILTEKPWALDLCRRLGIEDRLIRTCDEHRRTLIVHRGRLEPLPEGFLLLAPTSLRSVLASSLFSWRGKLRMAADLVLPRRHDGRDESLADFVTRRFGREVLDRVAQPLAGGIYTADPGRLSLAATMPRFIEMERKHRSVILGLRRQLATAARADSGARWSMFVSFKDGMQTLVDALVARLPADTARLSTSVRALARDAGGRWRVVLDEAAGTLVADAVVIATPAHVAAGLVRGVDAAMATSLAAVPYASSTIVTLAYDRAHIPHPLDAFGFVVPAIENRQLIAGTFSSVKYSGRAPSGAALLRVFLGGALAERMAALPDDDLLASARRELRELLGVTAPPLFTRIARYPLAMPQYHLGHMERIHAIEQRLTALPGLALAGNAYRGVGIPDCIHSGERAAEIVMRDHVAARAAAHS